VIPTSRCLRRGGFATCFYEHNETRRPVVATHCSFVYSAFACFRIGISGSASFQSVRKS